MTPDLDELARLARAADQATPNWGRFEGEFGSEVDYGHPTDGGERYELGETWTPELVEYLLAAQPPAILALLSRLRAAESETRVVSVELLAGEDIDAPLAPEAAEGRTFSEMLGDARAFHSDGPIRARPAFCGVLESV